MNRFLRVSWPAQLSAILVLVLASPLAAAAPTTVRIGVVFDGPSADGIEASRRLADEIRALVEPEFQVSLPESLTRVGDGSNASVQVALDELARDPDVDLIIAMGLLASNAVCCRPAGKPTVAVVVVDAALQGFPRRGTSSGIDNLAYVALPDPMRGDLETFRRLVPFDRVAVLAPAGLLEAIPGLAARAAQAVGGTGIALKVVAIGDTAAPVLDALTDTDAVYVTSVDPLSREEQQRLLDGLIDRRLPGMALGYRARSEGTLGRSAPAGTSRSPLASSGSHRSTYSARRASRGHSSRFFASRPADPQHEDRSRDRRLTELGTARRGGCVGSGRVTRCQHHHPLAGDGGGCRSQPRPRSGATGPSGRRPGGEGREIDPSAAGRALGTRRRDRRGSGGCQSRCRSGALAASEREPVATPLLGCRVGQHHGRRGAPALPIERARDVAARPHARSSDGVLRAPAQRDPGGGAAQQPVGDALEPRAGRDSALHR